MCPMKNSRPQGPPSTPSGSSSGRNLIHVSRRSSRRTLTSTAAPDKKSSTKTRAIIILGIALPVLACVIGITAWAVTTDVLRINPRAHDATFNRFGHQGKTRIDTLQNRNDEDVDVFQLNSFAKTTDNVGVGVFREIPKKTTVPRPATRTPPTTASPRPADILSKLISHMPIPKNQKNFVVFAPVADDQSSKGASNGRRFDGKMKVHDGDDLEAAESVLSEELSQEIGVRKPPFANVKNTKERLFMHKSGEILPAEIKKHQVMNMSRNARLLRESVEAKVSKNQTNQLNRSDRTGQIVPQNNERFKSRPHQLFHDIQPQSIGNRINPTLRLNPQQPPQKSQISHNNQLTSNYPLNQHQNSQTIQNQAMLSQNQKHTASQLQQAYLPSFQNPQPPPFNPPPNPIQSQNPHSPFSSPQYPKQYNSPPSPPQPQNSQSLAYNPPPPLNPQPPSYNPPQNFHNPPPYQKSQVDSSGVPQYFAPPPQMFHTKASYDSGSKYSGSSMLEKVIEGAVGQNKDGLQPKDGGQHHHHHHYHHEPIQTNQDRIGELSESPSRSSDTDRLGNIGIGFGGGGRPRGLTIQIGGGGGGVPGLLPMAGLGLVKNIVASLLPRPTFGLNSKVFLGVEVGKNGGLGGGGGGGLSGLLLG